VRTASFSRTPREIVAELDRHVVGQHAAKRAVAVALRNRWRRQNVASPLRDEIFPANIILIGPTGVGKTEIARRVARLTGAPFLKVEASKFTEVGYVGRDVESMVRDLAEVAVNVVKQELAEAERGKAEKSAEERLLDLLLPPPPRTHTDAGDSARESWSRSRERLRADLHAGRLDERTVEIEIAASLPSGMQVLGGFGSEEIDRSIRDMFSQMMPKKGKRRTVKVPEAWRALVEEEAQKLVDMDRVMPLAVERVETSGILFIDEIDKIAGERGRVGGPDVSREGVQRDLLPIVEGTSVPTKYGAVRTDHILFIAAGAFHVSKPSDLIPELQGRFPIRVELDPLTRDDLHRILTEPENALPRQYHALLETEGVALEFAPDALTAIADMAASVNERTENIGARRLQTILAVLLEEILFETPESGRRELRITEADVRRRLETIAKDADVGRYIL
jgi:ATP-dependent HslUV protease ATP-binding subunit HslU